MDKKSFVVSSNENCTGCDRCMKRCPTEAIRIENGFAHILSDRCLGCGECVRVCPNHAKTEYYDSIEDIKNFKYKVALVSPAIFGQFNNLNDIDILLNAVKRLGFDDVCEVSIGAEILSDAYSRLYTTLKKPIISSACPAIRNLILMKYETLVDNISPLYQPEEVVAKLALERAERVTSFKRKEIGIFLITQCEANVIELKRNASDIIDGVIAFKDIYFSLLSEMKKVNDLNMERLSKANWSGIISGSNTGEALKLFSDNMLTASGIENAVSILDELERGTSLTNIDFIEMYACTTGCTGGSANMENRFLARTRLRQLRDKISNRKKIYHFKNYKAFMHEPYKAKNVYALSADRGEPLELSMKMHDIYSKLPKIDCGNCGAPTCRAFAEDIVKGFKRKCRYLDEEGQV